MIKQVLTRIALILFFFILSMVGVRGNIWAAEFLFDYDVYYTVNQNGNTDVQQNILLTNLSTHYYAENFTLTISSEQISQVSASDTFGKILPKVEKQNGQTSLIIPFNKAAIGVNKQLPFSIYYKAADIAVKKGRIWEILIPGIEKNDSIRSYNIHFIAPVEFGKIAYINPPPQKGGMWDIESLKGGGIAAAYGDFQNFSFNLKYSLENLNNSSEIQEITLPLDTNLQKVIISRISSAPRNVRMDQDGNWLAQFLIAPREKKNIYVEGNVLIFLNPFTNSEILSEEQRKVYTKPQKFWEQTDEITQLAEKLKTPKNIYDWVVTNLKYDYTRINAGANRLGAETAFETKRAVCTEFSDMFISLARAAGVPARAHEGFAFSSNSRLQPLSLTYDVLHAWPEYYDEDSHLWIQVDPTWGNTTRGVDYFSKLDFNHITFSVLGENSQYPYPAGSFKTAESTKDVFVDFDINPITLPQELYVLEIKAPKFIFPGNNTVTASIRNKGKILLSSDMITLDSSLTANKKSQASSSIPPYGYQEIKFLVSPQVLFNPLNASMTLSFRNKKEIINVSIVPFYEVLLFLAALVLTIGLIHFWRSKPYRRKKKYAAA